MRDDILIRNLKADFRGYRDVVIGLLLNAAACWLCAEIIGGSALLGEVPHHQPPFIEMGGERVVVSSWLYQFSFWHGFSVFLSVPWALIFALVLLCQHGLAWLQHGRPHLRECAGGAEASAIRREI